jgi:hypothetical protein
MKIRTDFVTNSSSYQIFLKLFILSKADHIIWGE